MPELAFHRRVEAISAADMLAAIENVADQHRVLDRRHLDAVAIKEHEQVIFEVVPNLLHCRILEQRAQPLHGRIAVDLFGRLAEQAFV